MRTFLLLAAVATVLAGVQSYTTKYDNIDLDQILSNDRLLKKYHECLLADTDEGCTPDGKDLKVAIPDALTNKCEKCNEKQRAGANKVIEFLVKQKPELWKPLQEKYDPTGEYMKKYEAEYKKISA